MILKRFGDTLLALGAILAIGAVVAYAFDFVPTLPPEVMKLIIYKLLFIGALGLIVIGAFARKLGAREIRPLGSGIPEPAREALPAAPPAWPRNDLEPEPAREDRS